MNTIKKLLMAAGILLAGQQAIAGESLQTAPSDQKVGLARVKEIGNTLKQVSLLAGLIKGIPGVGNAGWYGDFDKYVLEMAAVLGEILYNFEGQNEQMKAALAQAKNAPTISRCMTQTDENLKNKAAVTKTCEPIGCTSHAACTAQGIEVLTALLKLFDQVIFNPKKGVLINSLALAQQPGLKQEIIDNVYVPLKQAIEVLDTIKVKKGQ